MARITEKNLILPALYFIYLKPNITTAELIIELTKLFNPTGEDALKNKGRNDSKFSQIVRNLISHKTLEDRLNYTTSSSINKVNYHNVTNNGLDFLNENLIFIEYVLFSGFSYDDMIQMLSSMEVLISQSKKNERNIIIYTESDLINEGNRKIGKRTYIERSKKLRDEAVDYYTCNKQIYCHCCQFDFKWFYGDIGEGFIEIHHQKPLYSYSDIDQNLFLQEAIKNTIPLCSNCHKMVHRKKNTTLSVEELRANIRQPLFQII